MDNNFMNNNFMNNNSMNNNFMNNNDVFNKKPLIEKYKPIFISTLVYAIFSTFALYKNLSGITFPFFTLATLVYFSICLYLLGVKLKNDTWFYMLSIELFGVSCCLTVDTRILFMNKIAISLLMMAFLLHEMYEDGKWDFMTYTKNILKQMFFSLENIPRPFEDGISYIKENGSIDEKRSKNIKNILKYVFIGIVIAVPILIVVIILLASADEIFAKSIRLIFNPEWIIENMGDVIGVCITFVFVFIAAYMQVSYLNEKRLKAGEKYDIRYEPVIGITVAAILCFVYILFCVIQIRYLFMGSISGKLSLPEGMTYSEYARTGFFQLLFISIINVIIVLFGIYKFKNSNALKILLTVITVCTYMLVASSALRMILYIQYKYLTFLRIFVLLALIIIAFILAGVLISIYKNNFPFFKYSMIVITLCYLAFSFTRPDYLIAKVNSDNMSKETQYDFFKDSPVYDDVDFLIYEIGIDGATALINEETMEAYNTMKETTGSIGYNRDYYVDYHKYKQEMFRYMYIKNLEDELGDMKIGFRSWNLSRYLAIELFDR